MKNVTPKAGQVWECIEETMITSVGRQRKIEKFDGIRATFVGGLVLAEIHKNYKFIPQSDLEWLAVNVDVWNGDKYPEVPEVIDNMLMRIGYKDWSFTSDGYTQTKWQNTRFELGLDEKPKATEARDFYNSLDINMMEKDAKMIDLSTAVVGDEFDCDNEFKGDVVMSVVFVDKSKTCFVLRGDGVGDMFVHANGKGVVSGRKCVITKHDPRHWLKDLPDADLFADEVTHIEYRDSITGWVVLAKNNWFCVNGIKMPKLTGDEWRDSKISIPDLKAWQEQNK